MTQPNQKTAHRSTRKHDLTYHRGLKNSTPENRILLWLQKHRDIAIQQKEDAGTTFRFDSEKIANDTKLDTRTVSGYLPRFTGLNREKRKENTVLNRRLSYSFTGDPIDLWKPDTTNA